MVKTDACPRIAIIDYGVGNVFSVAQACRYVGLEPEITTDPATISKAHGVVLPGVGAYSYAMGRLHAFGLVDALKDFAASSRPMMGVCLGFQLLFDFSDEMGRTEGLGLVSGKVSSLRDALPARRDGMEVLRAPNVGWCRIRPPLRFSNQESWTNTMLQAVATDSFMYFVHSYFAAPTEIDVHLADANYYGFEFCCAIERGNMFGCQFHPEKSDEAGLMIYRNFAKRLGAMT